MVKTTDLFLQCILFPPRRHHYVIMDKGLLESDFAKSMLHCHCLLTESRLQIEYQYLVVHKQVHLSEQKVISTMLEPLSFDWDTTWYLLLYMWCNLACVTLLLVGSGIFGALHQLPV